MSLAPRRFSDSPTIAVMAGAVEKAARSLIKDFREVENLQVSQKGPRDFVSVADQRAEKILHAELSKAFPDHGFLMEESGEILGDAPFRWIIDPLDGTTNFLHGIPHFAISVALEVNGRVTAAVIYDPIKDECFWAERGRGAYLNNQRLRVSTRNRLENALLLCDISPLRAPDAAKEVKLFTTIIQKTSFRSFGAASLNLAYIAAGRADGYVAYNLKPWDVAAGILLVREAGGTVNGIAMRDVPETGTSLVATNDAFSSNLLDFLNL